MLQAIKNFLKVDFHDDRIYGFDIIRTTAIISVLFGHGAMIIPGKPNSFYTQAYEFLDGVFVFFILSGFLIGQLLIYILENREVNKATLINFWKKRLLRTVPAYYFILLVLIILSLLTIKGFGSIQTLFYFLFIQNFCTSHPFFFAEAWTLSIEVWFYILVPLTIFILRGYGKLSIKKSIIYTVILFVLIGFLARWYRYLTLPYIDGAVVDQMFRKQVITRIDSVTFGIIGAYVFRFHANIWQKWRYVSLVIGILIFLYTKYPLLDHGYFFRGVLFFSLQSLSFLLILPYFSTIKTGKGIIYTIITTLSYVSFSIYLINLNLVQTFVLNNIPFEKLFGESYLIIKYVLYILISVIGGIYMYKKVELPFMNLRKKIQ